MKVLKIILWGVNLLFMSYLVNSFTTTAYMQDKDYQGVEKGNELHSQIYRRNNFYFYQDKLADRIKELESNIFRSYDSIILNKFLKIKNLADAYKSRINAISPDNEKNTSKIYLLLADYEEEIKALDTSFHRLPSLDWGDLRSIYSEQRLLQKSHIAIFQDDIERFSQTAIRWMIWIGGSSVDYTFDKTIVMANSQYEMVVEGENYEANLLFCYSDKTFFVINSKIDSGEISVEKDISYIKIPAQATTFDENGECRKKWKAEITIATARKDTTYFFEKEYTVKKKQQ